MILSLWLFRVSSRLLMIAYDGIRELYAAATMKKFISIYLKHLLEKINRIIWWSTFNLLNKFINRLKRFVKVELMLKIITNKQWILMLRQVCIWFVVYTEGYWHEWIPLPYNLQHILLFISKTRNCTDKLYKMKQENNNNTTAEH